MAPSQALRTTREAIESAFRFQSLPITVQWTPINPNSGRRCRKAGDRKPYGGRNRETEAPVASMIASCAADSSLRTRLAEQKGNLGCVCVWLPMAWPARITDLAIPGFLCTFCPHRKNVASTSRDSSKSRNRSVSGPGPSSNVSAISLRPLGRRHRHSPQRCAEGHAAEYVAYPKATAETAPGSHTLRILPTPTPTVVRPKRACPHGG